MSFFQQELDKLLGNSEQKEAYLSNDHCVVLAGPGSGKTATLSLKILRLLENNIPAPQGLACLTYNNEAVREFRHRLRLLGLPTRPNVFLGTVHSFCLNAVIRPFAKIFRPELPYPLIVITEKNQIAALQRAMDFVGERDNARFYKFKMDLYRRTHLDRDSANWHADDRKANIIEKYEEIIRGQGCIDFDDQIIIALDIIENEPFVRKCLAARYPWLVIDEYQDLGYPLHRIVTTLIGSTPIKIFAVGDPDQSIYSFAGADPKYIEELSSRDDTKKIQLKLNYRCGQSIIDGAGTILAPEIPREYESARGEDDRPGEITFVQETAGFDAQIRTVIENILPSLDEAGYERRNIAILYKNKYDAQIISDALTASDIKFSGEKDQRYKRTPLTRWVEGMAQWCCGLSKEQGVRFEELFSFWMALQRDAGKVFGDQEDLKEKQNYYRCLSDAKNPTQKAINWLNTINSSLSIQALLSSSKIRPDEKDTWVAMMEAFGEGDLADFLVEDIAGCGAHSNNLVITTLHSSKGQQFDVVIIPGMEEGRLPRYNRLSGEALKEERRTFYVAFTRARFAVYILYSGWYPVSWGQQRNGPSRFVKELQETITQH